MNHLSWNVCSLTFLLIYLISFDITDLKQSSTAAEEKQNQPEAEQQGNSEAQSMETSSSADGSQNQEKEEKEKRKEAKVRPLFTNLEHSWNLFTVIPLLFLFVSSGKKPVGSRKTRQNWIWERELVSWLFLLFLF